LILLKNLPVILQVSSERQTSRIIGDFSVRAERVEAFFSFFPHNHLLDDI